MGKMNIGNAYKVVLGPPERTPDEYAMDRRYALQPHEDELQRRMKEGKK